MATLEILTKEVRTITDWESSRKYEDLFETNEKELFAKIT